ncbi:GNAT family N-acetyltransferase [Uliginosibacterium sp. 31-12]|uniref:GNAT family N-acetyltransferase n=1 Tax=Uliginosibacterium sp. 31-12 TaxID=3062781 RepID=UPI0026E36414|nr:GNAT family N-acetyltransferase [Uliginosibacterium sp. 31-12]MDO6387554.1 GNAT family N-acetyltransferase [Uliginosibacterium sp. 31-12]
MEFRHHARISEIPARAWDALAPNDQPFLRHAYLHALEATACVGEGTGWQSAHAALWDDGRLLAAMPLYLKQHSMGEYVFDWSWAEAYARHGLDYYPKWLAAIPFTPVPGQRVLGVDAACRRALLGGVLQAAQHSGLSSLHLLFAATDEVRWAQELGCMRRTSVQFHWHNAGYRNFEDFLAALSGEKRKKIRQERRRVAEAGVSLRVLEGARISRQDWAFFTRCYTRTYALHRSAPYLNLDFFELLGERLPQHCVLLIAHQSGQDIAASLLLRDSTSLYGRYWGTLAEVSCLHFEACYYAPIEYAIQHGLQRFEGGAQGEHKLARGLQPVETSSLHWLADARFARAVEDFLARESDGMAQYISELEARNPLQRQNPLLLRSADEN